MSYPPRTGLELANGTVITSSDTGDWIVSSDTGEWPLHDVPDFYRAWLLLEQSFPEVKTALDEVASNARASTPFSFANLVECALRSGSRNWGELAMGWLPQLTDADRRQLRDALAEVVESKQLSQKARQVARKYVNQIK